MAWKKERSMVWLLLLYPDSERHIRALEFIKKNYVEYAFIKHFPEKEENKEHYHLVIRFKNYRWNTALSEELDVEINMFEKCRGLCNALIYLIHLREPEKIQYSVEDVQGPFQTKLKCIMQTDGKDNSDMAYEIVQWIMGQNNRIKYSQLFFFAKENGLYSELLRGMKLFSYIMEEHNNKFF